MAGQLEANAIRDYLLQVGYKIEYPKLVNAFKRHLYNPDPAVQGRIRTQFKDYVNTLATVSLENNMKFIILRPEFRPPPTLPPPPPPPPAHQTPVQVVAAGQPVNGPAMEVLKPRPRQQLAGATAPVAPLAPPTSPPSAGPRVSAALAGATPRTTGRPLAERQMGPPPPPPPHQEASPRAPARRRQSNVSLFAKPPAAPARLADEPDAACAPPARKAALLARNGSHLSKERSHSMDSVSAGPQQQQQQVRPRSSVRGEDESDSSSLQPLDPARRRWALEASKCNYQALVAMLRDEPKLAHCKDMVNGYTALHWAAKFGALALIRLLAGAHQVSPNTRSSSGQTALHVARLFGRHEAADLLLNTYAADQNIRDHSGRLAAHYARPR